LHRDDPAEFTVLQPTWRFFVAAMLLLTLSRLCLSWW
jgi:hypothetical protein